MSLSAWKAVPDFSLCNFHDVLPSRQYIEKDIVIPAHPRYSRMYGVTNSIAFQALPHFRNLNYLLAISHYTYYHQGEGENNKVMHNLEKNCEKDWLFKKKV